MHIKTDFFLFNYHTITQTVNLDEKNLSKGQVLKIVQKVFDIDLL